MYTSIFGWQSLR